MSYKRVEIYVGWTCNQKCTYCKEFPNMEVMWDTKVSTYDILKLLIKYKQKGYDHVSFLGGEPLIQAVFFDALKIAKKMGFTILVTTNCTTLHLENQASKFLPYIDELILSMEALDTEKQQLISRTNAYVNWDLVFKNISKFWNGKMLKSNIVITKDNLDILFDLVKESYKNNITEIAITYPDIDIKYYSKEHVMNRIAPSYSECVKEIGPIIKFCLDNKIRLKLPDFPFCVFGKDKLENYIKMTDDYDYGTRVNVFRNKKEIDRGDLKEQKTLPRERQHFDKCNNCKYIDMCWGPSKHYDILYTLDEINPII